jgi:hypothetical protein
MKMETDRASETACYILEYLKIASVKKSTNAKCNTPSSEPCTVVSPGRCIARNASQRVVDV